MTPSLISVLNLLAGTLLLLYAVWAARKIVTEYPYTVLIVIVWHFVQAGLPLLLDELVPRPEYAMFPRFQTSANDPTAQVLYSLYAAACPLFWLWTVRIRTLPRQFIALSSPFSRSIPRQRVLTAVFVVLLVAPAASLTFVPDLGTYAQYASFVGTAASHESLSVHGYVHGLTILSVIAAAAIASNMNSWSAGQLYLVPLVFLSVWLNGKRHIVALVLLLVLLLVWQRRRRRRPSSRFALIFVVGILIAFLCQYQIRVRGVTFEELSRVYESNRMDFCKDQAIRTTMYAELVSGDHILRYRMESVVFALTFYIPRGSWPGKPWPYYVYFTAYALGIEPRVLGWGLTTSWLEEAIANCGWLGLLVGPGMIAAVCRYGDKTGIRAVHVVTVAVATLLLSADVSAWLGLAGLWVAAVCAGFGMHARVSGPSRDGTALA
jgi:hypothetical protein